MRVRRPPSAHVFYSSSMDLGPPTLTSNKEVPVLLIFNSKSTTLSSELARLLCPFSARWAGLAHGYPLIVYLANAQMPVAIRLPVIPKEMSRSHLFLDSLSYLAVDELMRDSFVAMAQP